MARPHNTEDNENRKFVDSPTRAHQSAVEVVVGNASDIGGGSATIEKDTAQENISAVKAVYKGVGGLFLASNNLNLSEASVVGITRTSAISGGNLDYQIIGKYFDSSLSFTVNDQVYLDINGNLTSTSPISGYRVLIGTAIDGGIQINIEEPIQL